MKAVATHPQTMIGPRARSSDKLAYMVRAISPGQFHHPAASVEDMYRPQMRANTDPGRVTISE